MKNPKTVTVYIDADYKCHTTHADGFRAFEVYGFEDKCTEYIEGHRYIPDGESWTRADGEVFTGEMVAPWKGYAELDAAQREYERRLLAEYSEALKVVGVTV